MRLQSCRRNKEAQKLAEKCQRVCKRCRRFSAFGVDDNKNVVGLANPQADAEAISRLIKERITPYPSFVLKPERENEKDILALTVFPGRTTPYYYRADGVREAYIRLGNESVVAPDHVLN